MGASHLKPNGWMLRVWFVCMFVWTSIIITITMLPTPIGGSILEGRSADSRRRRANLSLLAHSLRYVGPFPAAAGRLGRHVAARGRRGRPIWARLNYYYHLEAELMVRRARSHSHPLAIHINGLAARELGRLFVENPAQFVPPTTRLFGPRRSAPNCARRGNALVRGSSRPRNQSRAAHSPSSSFCGPSSWRQNIN